MINDAIIRFIILFTMWTIASLLAKVFKLEERGIIVYPLVVIIKSKTFKGFIEKESLRRGKFWSNYGRISPIIAIFLILIAVMYFIFNIYYLLQRTIIFTAGVPVGSPLVPIIPFITVDIDIMLYLLLASAIAIIPHEVAHGVIAVRNGIELKSAGFFIILGAIFGGFVEIPEDYYEKLLEEDVEDDIQIKRIKALKKVLAAGLLANAILFLILAPIVYNYNLIVSPFYKENGILIIKVEENSPAENAGLKSGIVIVSINNTAVHNYSQFKAIIESSKPGDTLVFETLSGEKYYVTVGSRSDNPDEPWIGVWIVNYYKSKIPFLPDMSYYTLFSFLYFAYLLQLIVIILNALPLFVTDGARLILVILKEKMKNQDMANALYYIINSSCVILILLNFVISF